MACFMTELPGDSIHNPSVPTHFMWVQPVEEQISVYHESLVLAVTTQALRVIEVGRDVFQPVFYLPRRDLCADLKKSARTTYCPLKGEASHFDLVDADGLVVVANAAWSYQEPLDFALSLKGRVAFDRARFAFQTSSAPEAILRLERHGGTLITCDSLQNFKGPDAFFNEVAAERMEAGGFLIPANIGPGWRNATDPKPSDFARLKELEFMHVLGGHGEPCLGDAKDQYGDTFNRLFGV